MNFSYWYFNHTIVLAIEPKQLIFNFISYTDLLYFPKFISFKYVIELIFHITIEALQIIYLLFPIIVTLFIISLFLSIIVIFYLNKMIKLIVISFWVFKFVFIINFYIIDLKLIFGLLIFTSMLFCLVKFRLFYQLTISCYWDLDRIR
jgi:hypothetical protein